MKNKIDPDEKNSTLGNTVYPYIIVPAAQNLGQYPIF